MSFLEFARVFSPTVLRGPAGRRFRGAIAYTYHLLAEGTRQAVRSTWIGDSVGPAYDALGIGGTELSLPRYPAESWSQYQARLDRAWEDWPFAGVESSIIGQLEAAGFPGAVIYHAPTWPTRPPVHWPNDTFPDHVWWSKFWVFFPAGTHSVSAPGPIVGDFSVGDGTVIGPVGLSSEQMRTIRGIVRKFDPSHWRGMQVIFEIDGWTVGTGHEVGEPGLTIGGSQGLIGL